MVNLDRETSPTKQALDQVKLLLVDQAQHATSLHDFALPHIANAYLDTEDFRWSMVGQDYTVETILQRLTEAKKKDAELDADAMEKWLECGVPVSDQTDMAAVSLTRVRKPDTTYSTRALVALPQGIELRNNFFPFETRQSQNNLVFFHPLQRCTEHALDDLYKVQRGEVYYMPFKPLEVIRQSLKRDPHTGVVEYVINTPQGRLKQDPTDFLLAGVQQGFSNDPAVMLISEFIARNHA